MTRKPTKAPQPGAPRNAAPSFAVRSLAVAEITQRLVGAQTPQNAADIVLPAPRDIIGDAIWEAAHHDAREIARLEVEILRLRQHAALLVGRLPTASGAFGVSSAGSSHLDADIPF